MLEGGMESVRPKNLEESLWVRRFRRPILIASGVLLIALGFFVCVAAGYNLGYGAAKAKMSTDAREQARIQTVRTSSLMTIWGAAAVTYVGIVVLFQTLREKPSE